jgi:hypothetical protein
MLCAAKRELGGNPHGRRTESEAAPYLNRTEQRRDVCKLLVRDGSHWHGGIFRLF